LYPESILSLIPAHTVPEIFRTPLEDTILQILLLEETMSSSPTEVLPWFENLIEPPPRQLIVHAAGHLMEIGALTNVGKGIFRLSPLGFHLSHLPMDCQVGKILLTGCLLGCIDISLTAAAILSASKSVYTGYAGGSKEKAQQIIQEIIDGGYGGRSSPSFHCKCDIAAQIAIFNHYESRSFRSHRERVNWCRDHAMDPIALAEIDGLRGQFRDILIDANFCTSSHNENSADPIFLQCVLASGLYPNIGILERPKQTCKRGGGR
jgi:HrpA-like RNA helicase